MIRSSAWLSRGAGRLAVRVCRRTSRRLSRSRGRGEASLQSRELSAYFIEHAYSKTAKAAGAAANAGSSRSSGIAKALEEQLAGHADLSRKGRRAQASVSAQAR